MGLSPRRMLYGRHDGWMFVCAYEPFGMIWSASHVSMVSVAPQCVHGHVSRSPYIASSHILRRLRSAELPRLSPPFRIAVLLSVSDLLTTASSLAREIC